MNGQNRLGQGLGFNWRFPTEGQILTSNQYHHYFVCIKKIFMILAVISYKWAKPSWSRVGLQLAIPYVRMDPQLTNIIVILYVSSYLLHS